MSKAQLKRAVKDMEAEELRELILEAYDSRKEIKEYFEYWLNPDEKELCVQTGLAIHKIFFKTNGRIQKTFKKSEINKLIKDFRAVCFNPEHISRLLLLYANNYAGWCSCKRHNMSHRESLMKIWNEALAYAEANDQLETHERIITNTRRMIDEMWWY